MIITKEWLIKQTACSEAIKEFSQQKENDSIKLLYLLIEKKEIKYLSWANWFIVRIMTYKQYAAYAIYAAELVINIFEKAYPKDVSPRNAIEAAKKYLKDPTLKNKTYAATAARAATAVYTAYAAAHAATAAYAAYAAAYAADADDAAYAVANAAHAATAADAAAYAVDATIKIWHKILNYGIDLLNS